MVTVVCVWVHGHVPFSPFYPIKLRSMVRRHLALKHRFVCLTDRPQALPKSMETVRIWHPPRLKGWWSKLRLFDPTTPLTGRVLYLDLDTLIVDALDPIVDYPAPFALIPTAGTFEGHGQKKVVKRFNSSVMVWNAGEQTDLYTRWKSDVARRLWGDQDWIGERKPEAAMMPLEWFPRLSAVRGPEDFGAGKVVLCKIPKNVKAAADWPWVRERWQ
jgi:hypothetical protein